MIHDFFFGYGHDQFMAAAGNLLISWLVASREVQFLVFQGIAVAMVWRAWRRTFSMRVAGVIAFALFFQSEAVVEAVQIWTLFHPAIPLRVCVNVVAAVTGLVALLAAVFLPSRNMTGWWRHEYANLLLILNAEREAHGKPRCEMPKAPGNPDDL